MRTLLTSLVALALLTGCVTLTDQFPWLALSSVAVSEDTQSPEGDTEVGGEEVSGQFEEDLEANASSPPFPIQAGSWGGKVRAGPGMGYAHVASLKEGDHVVLIDITDVDMNGYSWFHIQYGNGSKGFKWGGILCAKDVWVDGLFENCPGYRELKLSAKVRPNANIAALDQIELAYGLLPGFWVRTSDSNAILVFDDKRGTFDMYDGQKVTAGSWTLEEHKDSPTMVTVRRSIDGNVDVYSILYLDSEELTLSFLPRGNTLSYRRAK